MNTQNIPILLALAIGIAVFAELTTPLFSAVVNFLL